MTPEIEAFVRETRENDARPSGDISEADMLANARNYARHPGFVGWLANDVIELCARNAAIRQQLADRDRAVDLLVDATGKVEAQAKQIEQLQQRIREMQKGNK